MQKFTAGFEILCKKSLEAYATMEEVRENHHILLKGKCGKSGKPVACCIETGKDENTVKIIKKLFKKSA